MESWYTTKFLSEHFMLTLLPYMALCHTQITVTSEFFFSTKMPKHLIGIFHLEFGM